MSKTEDHWRGKRAKVEGRGQRLWELSLICQTEGYLLFFCFRSQKWYGHPICFYGMRKTEDHWRGKRRKSEGTKFDLSDRGSPAILFLPFTKVIRASHSLLRNEENWRPLEREGGKGCRKGAKVVGTKFDLSDRGLPAILFLPFTKVIRASHSLLRNEENWRPLEREEEKGCGN